MRSIHQLLVPNTVIFIAASESELVLVRTQIAPVLTVITGGNRQRHRHQRHIQHLQPNDTTSLLLKRKSSPVFKYQHVSAM